MLIEEWDERSVESARSATIAQRSSETAREFEARAFSALTAASPGVAPETIVIACNDRGDHEASAVRSTLCCAALALLSRARRGRVLLVAREGTQAARQVRDLARSFNRRLAGSPFAVDVTTPPVLASCSGARQSRSGLGEAQTADAG